MEKLIGAQIKAGQFLDKQTLRMVDYNNLVLYTTTTCDNGFGEMYTHETKIKNDASTIISVFGQPISMKWLKERLGWYVIILLNDYKKPVRVEFYKEDPTLQPVAYKGEPTAEGITDYEHPAKQEVVNEIAGDYPPEFMPEFSNETVSESSDDNTERKGA